MSEYKIPYEFIDYIAEVMEFGAKKHGDLNWRGPDGAKSSHKDMHAAMFRHIAESSAGNTEDHETGYHPLAHAATRCLMQLYRFDRGLVHKDDKGV